MDAYFQERAFHLRPIMPGATSAGFVFTPLDLGTKIVQVCLHAGGDWLDILTGRVENDATEDKSVLFTFSLKVPGIAADYLRRDLAELQSPQTTVECDVTTLVKHLREMPAATSNRQATHTGDPVNLVVLGEFETILGAFAARWDESETITLDTCWKTVRSFLLGSQYRYSPVSPLYLFGRSRERGPATPRAARSTSVCTCGSG